MRAVKEYWGFYREVDSIWGKGWGRKWEKKNGYGERIDMSNQVFKRIIFR
jgi:hypothetical protein